MTNREQAMDTMFQALYNELTNDSAAYDGDDDFMEEAAAYMEEYVLYKQASVEAHVDNSGFSAEKLAAKIFLADMCSNLSGKAYVKFTNLEKPSLAEQLHIEPTDFMHAADAVCAQEAQADHNLMLANLTDLSPNTVTAVKLTALQTAIDTFKNLQGNSETVHEVSPTLTKDFKNSAKPLKKRITHFKLLGRDYKISNAGFFKRLMASMVIPTINVHHTYLDIHAEAKNTGNPVAHIVFTLTKGKKSATTDIDGNALIEEVKAGKDVLTGTLNGTVVVTMNVTIKRGTTTHVPVVIG